MKLDDIAADRDALHSIGQGALALFNAAVMLTVVAVILSARSGTPAIIKSAFQFLAWLVSQVVQPVTKAAPTNLTATPALADTGVYGNIGNDNTAANVSATSSTTGIAGTGSSGGATTTWVSPDYQTIYHGTNPPAGYMPANSISGGTISMSGGT